MTKVRKIDSSVYNELRKVKDDKVLLKLVKEHTDGMDAECIYEFTGYVAKIAYDNRCVTALDYLLKLEGGCPPNLLGRIHSSKMILSKEISESDKKFLKILCEHIPVEVFLDTIDNCKRQSNDEDKHQNRKKEVMCLALINSLKDDSKRTTAKLKKI